MLLFIIMRKLELKNCAHVKGVFTKQPLTAGEEILQFDGPVVGSQDLPDPYTAKTDYYLQIGENLFMGPSGKIDDYVNHSCQPNCGIKFDVDAIKLVAIVPINAGHQITFDYSTTMHNATYKMKCACGLKKCRRRVKNFVELPAEIQARYIKLGIVPRYLLHLRNRQS
ncbi:MAG: SET domain-containing protein-lysine N-methyltransferase [Desulfobacterales bacterium]|nr:SET domain-containing protein-lysine N-methyltransferase [Desulfobacterales bacterium]